MLKLFHRVDSSEPAIVEMDDIETEINEHTIDLEIDVFIYSAETPPPPTEHQTVFCGSQSHYI